MSHAAISLSGPSSDWTSLGAKFDAFDDLQTGDPSSDIIGDADNPGFFTRYDPTGDILAFRIRMDAPGGNKNNPDFDRNVWVGIDIGIDDDDVGESGRLDVFVGASRAGNGNSSVITGTGTGDNVSPSTTSIDSTPYKEYTLDSTELTGNFNYREVTASDSPSLDLTMSTTGDTDYYISFSIIFSDLVAYIESINTSSGLTIDENTPLQYIVGTSTQSNALNQDMGGTALLPNDATRFDDPSGAFSPLVTGSGTLIPEPSSLMLVLLSSSLLLRRKRA